MATITFATKLKSDGSLKIPKEAVNRLGLHPGDEVQVNVETIPNLHTPEEKEQAKLQSQFDTFFAELDISTFESPENVSRTDVVEVGFSEAMEEKFHQLGFVP
jgi:antitoxin component of MazEF toxin-antitoxin module